jgi:hypothetical protein
MKKINQITFKARFICKSNYFIHLNRHSSPPLVSNSIRKMIREPQRAEEVDKNELPKLSNALRLNSWDLLIVWCELKA